MLTWLLTCSILAPGADAQVLGYGKPSTAAETSHVFKTAGGALYGFQVNTGAVAVWVMLIDAATVPTAGGAAVAPVKWWQVAINTTLAVQWAPSAILLTSGIVILCSSTGPFTYTATATCEFSGETQ